MSSSSAHAAVPTEAPTSVLEVSAGEGSAAVKELVEREYASVWRFLRRLGVPAPHVEDAAQIVFARVLGKERTILPGAERAYLMKAAFHISFEYRRAQKRAAARSADLEIDALTDEQPTPDEALSQRRDRELLDRALARLPADLRAAFTLFELEGLTFTEISEVLAVPRGTVASRVRRARELFTLAVHRLNGGKLR